MVCPDSDCHTKLTDMCKLVHSSQEGLSSKVSRASATKWVIAIIGFFVSIVIVLALAWGKAADERKQNKQDIAVISVSLENLRELLLDIKSNQVTKGDIYKAIKRAREEDD